MGTPAERFVGYASLHCYIQLLLIAFSTNIASHSFETLCSKPEVVGLRLLAVTLPGPTPSAIRP